MNAQDFMEWFGESNETQLINNSRYGEDLFAVSMASYSDYAGTAVERSNAKYLLDKFPRIFEECYGGYGTVWITLVDDLPDDSEAQGQYEEIENLLDNLIDYPLFDDEYFSNMEWELALEAWDWVKHEGDDLKKDDFIKWVSEKAEIMVEKGGNVYFFNLETFVGN